MDTGQEEESDCSFCHERSHTLCPFMYQQLLVALCKLRTKHTHTGCGGRRDDPQLHQTIRKRLA